jgi:hypothetical protein
VTANQNKSRKPTPRTSTLDSALNKAFNDNADEDDDEDDELAGTYSTEIMDTIQDFGQLLHLNETESVDLYNVLREVNKTLLRRYIAGLAEIQPQRAPVASTSTHHVSQDTISMIRDLGS